MRFYGTVCDRLKNPFKNIPVTDGRNIVFTDENGKFDFEGWDDAGILSLNILTNGHDDLYFMVDGHKGSYDFEIRPADEAENFSVLHTSDTEIENEYDMSWVDDLKKTNPKDLEAAKASAQKGDLAAAKESLRGLLNDPKIQALLKDFGV